MTDEEDRSLVRGGVPSRARRSHNFRRLWALCGLGTLLLVITYLARFPETPPLKNDLNKNHKNAESSVDNETLGHHSWKIGHDQNLETTFDNDTLGQFSWAKEKLVDWRQHTKDRAELCRNRLPLRNRMEAAEVSLLEAECGSGYDVQAVRSNAKPWTVKFYTVKEFEMMMFTGCPRHGTGHCPLSPNCRFEVTGRKHELGSADVVVVFQTDADRITDIRYDASSRKPYRVLLWREAFWGGPRPTLQRENIDIEMGTHYFAGILNPHWFLPPSVLLSGSLYSSEPVPFLPVGQRPYFALSVISHCASPSMRDYYLKHLVQSLGEDKIHQYGACGNRSLPPRPISNAAKVFANYKFYLSFENAIQSGYVTEKLLEILTVPLIPVYYGDPSVPNITVLPSFIRASDFRSPSSLAEYLLFLDAHPDEYNKYHAWRSQKTPFDKLYLRLLRDKVPGPLEMENYLVDMKTKRDALKENEELDAQAVQRRALCCRLCNEMALQNARDEKMTVVPPMWGSAAINRRFFDGSLAPEPHHGARNTSGI